MPQNPRKVEIPAADETLNPTANEDQIVDVDETGEESKKPIVDFVTKNATKLREMQESRNKELKEIEDNRAKLLRRQEKLK